MRDVSVRMLAAGFLTFIAGGTGLDTASRRPSAPAVGIVEAIRRPITETNEFLGRIEAVNRVNVVARVTAFLEQRLFVEGAELKKGDPLTGLSAVRSRPISRRSRRRWPSSERCSRTPS